MVVFAVTSLESRVPSGKRMFRSKATRSYHTSLQEARERVESNELDMFETSFVYAVIESIEIDHPCPVVSDEYRQWWYMWEGDQETGKFVVCQVPEVFKQIVGFCTN